MTDTPNLEDTPIALAEGFGLGDAVNTRTGQTELILGVQSRGVVVGYSVPIGDAQRLHAGLSDWLDEHASTQQ